MGARPRTRTLNEHETRLIRKPRETRSSSLGPALCARFRDDQDDLRASEF
jgi:hypothetical protein